MGDELWVMDDERLKNLGGGGYWKELLQRIRDIRASEKVFYRQVLDIYATSMDYDPKADVSIEFFKKVQNKIHYAVHGQTAAEVIFTRADAEKEFMGLMTFTGAYSQWAEKTYCKVQAMLATTKWNGINHRLLKWVKWEKGLYKYAAVKWLRLQYKMNPNLYYLYSTKNMESRLKGDFHVRFCRETGVRFPCQTRLGIRLKDTQPKKS